MYHAFSLSNLCWTDFGNHVWCVTKFLQIIPWKLMEFVSFLTLKLNMSKVETRGEWNFFCQFLKLKKMSYCGNKVMFLCKELKSFVSKFLCNVSVSLCTYVCIFSSVIKTRLIYDWHGSTTWPPNTARYVLNTNKSFVSLCVAFRFPSSS